MKNATSKSVQIIFKDLVTCAIIQNVSPFNVGKEFWKQSTKVAVAQLMANPWTIHYRRIRESHSTLDTHWLCISHRESDVYIWNL